MAYTPFFQGTEATNIINGYLDQNVNANTPMAQPDMNQYGVFRNPYSPEGFYANETDQYPVEFVPPVTDKEGIPACPEGYVYDEVMKSCRYVGFSEPAQEDSDREETDTRTESQKMYDEMKKDVTDPFGANRFVDKYEDGVDEFGNPIYKFNPSTGVLPFFGIPIIDQLTGGPQRREDKYNTAINTIMDQTKSRFYNNNPFAFGSLNGDYFTKFNDKNYLDRVQNEIVRGSNQNATMGELLGSVGQGTAPINQGGQGSEPVDIRGSSLVIQSDGGTRRRDDTAYESAVAKNIARNLAGDNSTGSGFSKSLGGFYKGR
jgi:hypothetical protein